MRNTQSESGFAGLGTLLHMLFWAVLFIALWLQWRPAMLLGFFVTIVNLSGFGLPVLTTAVLALISLPFAGRNDEAANISLALVCLLILQVWQFSFWIQGAAAH